MTKVTVAQTDVPGCTIQLACNYDPAATVDDGSCDFTTCLVLGCTDNTACNYDPAATINDGSCDYLSCLVPGCTLANACNYDPAAEVNDGSCEYTSCAGCTNEFADNYDATATVDDGSCNPIEGCTSPQACNFDPNANADNGSCDFTSCLATGCTNQTACNFDPAAQVNDGSCVFPEEGKDCDGNCLADADGDGVCDGDEVLGCTSGTAFNFNPLATEDDGSCQEPVGGCTNPEACNFDALATTDDGSCEFESCAGCLQSSACNFDPDAIYSDGSCEFPDFGYNCAGECLNDTDGDGVCNPFEVVGCQDMMACNYNPAATDAGQCNYAAANFDCDGNSLKPIFTSFPANVTVQGWEVPAAEDAVVEAIVSPFAPSFEATYNDNLCYDSFATPTVAYNGESRIDGVCVHDYTLVRSWTATDCAGYSRTRQQIIVVVDTVAPQLFVPENLTVLCQDAAMADLGEATATDDCGEVSISVTSEVIPGQCSGSYSIVRTFVAIDPCLNSTEGQQVISVVDNQAPVMETLGDLTISCEDAIPTSLPAATDNCGAVTVTETTEVIAGECAGNYTVLRSFEAADDCGNTSTSSQTITVVDDAAPVVVDGPCFGEGCALDINELNGESVPSATLTVADNCDAEATWSSNDVSTQVGPTSFQIVRTYTLSDDCGNTVSYDQYINVTVVLEGCLDSAACNYDADANASSGDCDFCSCGENACGCTDAEACNYDSGAAYDDGSCE
ncbi:MAG: hypothetical protein P8H88_03935, partial [Flavobacteriales bacterium]|nr:hypothetical protein [Flavobacteriales bacterium]